MLRPPCASRLCSLSTTPAMFSRSVVVAALLGVLSVSALQGSFENDANRDWLYSDQLRFGVDGDGVHPPKFPAQPHWPKPLSPGKATPPHKNHEIEAGNKTIFQVLKDEPESVAFLFVKISKLTEPSFHRFARIFKLVNFTKEIRTLLNDSSQKYVFQAHLIRMQSF